MTKTYEYKVCSETGKIGCSLTNKGDFGEGKRVTPEALADIMRYLQQQGCRNINLVSPSHYVPQIVAALAVRL